MPVTVANRAADEVSLLRATNVSKRYDGVRALDGISFELRAGEVHALVGENGAGKSTFIKILTGAVLADSGEILVEGTPVTQHSPRAAKELGLAAIYQQPALFPELTVAENLAIGVERHDLWGRVDWRGRRARAVELLARVGARIDPDIEAGELSMPEQQLVEIARALGADAKVLVFDEPTASLSEDDARNLFRVIDELRARGVGSIYISHRLEEIARIADRVTVLRDGRTIGTREMRDVAPGEIIQMMVGRELSAVFPKRVVPIGDPILTLRDVGCVTSGVHDVTLELRRGEIVGLAGLVGAGRTELARIVFGLTPATSGEINVGGRAALIDCPATAIALGIAYCPEDRRRHGVLLDMPVSANVTLASLDTLTSRRRLGALDFEREGTVSAQAMRRLAIKAPSIFTLVGALSGGNQQKVALSRWLLTNPDVLILDEPTQGIDVGAKAEIHSLICDLAAQGIGILMISSELPEILGMSDRIAVMCDGTIVEVLSRGEATQERVLAHALRAPIAAA